MHRHEVFEGGRTFVFELATECVELDNVWVHRGSSPLRRRVCRPPVPDERYKHRGPRHAAPRAACRTRVRREGEPREPSKEATCCGRHDHPNEVMTRSARPHRRFCQIELGGIAEPKVLRRTAATTMRRQSKSFSSANRPAAVREWTPTLL